MLLSAKQGEIASALDFARVVLVLSGRMRLSFREYNAKSMSPTGRHAVEQTDKVRRFS